MEQSRKKIIAGNWKMYKTAPEAVDFIEKLKPHVADTQAGVYLAVPFTAIEAAAKAAQETPIVIGAQNMNDASEGAFTGEIAASMLIDAGARFVILGHSERRHVFNESSAFIQRKVKQALAHHLQPILCIGETLAEREAQNTHAVLQQQLHESLEGISAEHIDLLVLAYEPVWAIGTGKTATPEIAQEAHQFCRSIVAQKWGEAVAQRLLILYGGSVKSDNAAILMQQSDIDGLLVGGASLSPETFSHIVNFDRK